MKDNIELLKQISHTLNLHGSVQQNTLLHERIESAIESAATPPDVEQEKIKQAAEHWAANHYGNVNTLKRGFIAGAMYQAGQSAVQDATPQEEGWKEKFKTWHYAFRSDSGFNPPYMRVENWIENNVFPALKKELSTLRSELSAAQEENNSTEGSRKHCSTCRSRKCRQSDPVKYAYYNLRAHAQERGLAFTITLDQFRDWCRKVTYIGFTGKSAESYTIDRKYNDVGYHIDNIRVMTRTDNVKKYFSYDSRAKTGVITTEPEDSNKEENYF